MKKLLSLIVLSISINTGLSYVCDVFTNSPCTCTTVKDCACGSLSPSCDNGICSCSATTSIGAAN